MSRKHSPYFAECLAAVRSGETNRLKNKWQCRLHKWEMKKIFHEKYLFMLKTIVSGKDMPKGWHWGLHKEQVDELYKMRGFGKVKKNTEHSKMLRDYEISHPNEKRERKEYRAKYLNPKMKFRILSRYGELKYKPIKIVGHSMYVSTYENHKFSSTEVKRRFVDGEFDWCHNGFRSVNWMFHVYESRERFEISQCAYNGLVSQWHYVSRKKKEENIKNSWKFIRKSIVEEAKMCYAKIKEREDEERSRRQLDLSMMLVRNYQSNNESLRQLRALGFVA